MNHSISIFIIFALSIASSLANAESTTKITVNGMVCAFCAQGIEKSLLRLPETEVVFVDLKQKTVAVQAKDGMHFNEETLKKLIADAGYAIANIEVVDQSVQELKAKMLNTDASKKGAE